MKFSDISTYSASQITAKVFNITLESGSVDMPASESDQIVFIKDDAGNKGSFAGIRVGAQFTIERILDPSLSTIPSFGEGTKLYCNFGKALVDRGKGMGAIMCIGQSNHLHHDTTNNTTSRDVPAAGVWQYRHNTLDSGGTPTATTDDGLQTITDPMWWYQASATAGAGSGLPVVHAANQLKWFEGFENIVILPGAKDGAGYQSGDWDKGEPAYENLKDMAIEFLNLDSDNYIICMLDIGGENDCAGGTLGPAYESAFDTMYTNLRADITAGTTNSYDMANVPLIVVGMNDVMATTVSTVAFNRIQNVRIDTPNRIDFSAYIDVSGKSAVDLYHHTTATARYIGETAFLPAYRSAMANFAVLETLAGVITASATLTAALVPQLAGSVTVSATLSGSIGAGTTAISGSTTASATLTGAITVTETPLTDALTPLIQLRGNRGITLNGSDVSNWQNYGTSSNDATQATAADQPLESSGSVVFDAANTEFLDLAEVFSNASGFSCVFEMAVTSGNGGTVLNDGQSRIFPTTAMQFVTLGDTGVSYAEDKRDGTLRKYRWVTDGSTVDVWEDGVQKITAQSITTAGTPSALVMGAFSSSLFHASCTFRNFVAKPAVQWTTTEMANIESEFT